MPHGVTGGFEVYVQSFPTPAAKYQGSANGGVAPVWSRDGKELFFIGADRNLMTAEVKSGGGFEASLPKALSHLQPGSAGSASTPWFTVGTDGRFLIATPSEQAGNVPMTVVINWTAALKK